MGNLIANVQLQQLLFGSPVREQKQVEEEEQEQLAACSYCRDAGPKGLPCNQCGVDGMIYNDPVDATYVVPKYNEDAEDADDKEEAETTKLGYNPMWMRCAQGTTIMSGHMTSTLEGEEKVTWAMCPTAKELARKEECVLAVRTWG